MPPTVSRSVPPTPHAGHRFLGPPATPAGRRSLKLLGIAVVAWVVMACAAALGVRGDSAVVLQIGFLLVPTVSGFLAVLAGFAYAVLAVARGERSLLIALPLLIGSFALVFVIGELAAPH